MLRLFCISAILVLITEPLFSCSIPVFQYSLARWRPDDYHALIVVEGDLTEEQQGWLDGLAKSGLGLSTAEKPGLDPSLTDDAGHGRGSLNCRIEILDLSSVSQDEADRLFRGAIPEELPALVLWYPRTLGQFPPFWTGPFNETALRALAHSPKRLELVQHLMKGGPGVWLYVTPANQQTGAGKRQWIKQQLHTALRELSEIMPFAGDTLAQSESFEGVPLIELDAGDEKEQILLSILLSSAPDLGSNDAILFPIFGRGRVLYPIAGQEIGERSIREAMSFLLGPCGCIIKSLNPGLDLLLTAEWEKASIFYFEDEMPLPELTGIMPLPPSDDYDDLLVVDEEKQSSMFNAGVIKITGLLFGAGLLVVILITFVTRRAAGRRSRAAGG